MAPAVALSAAEVGTFLEASLLLALAVAEVHGEDISDLERRRTLLLGILLGDGAAGFIERAAGRTGGYWGKTLVKKMSNETIKSINRAPGPRFLVKWGTKQGVLVLGRVVPFGFGAAIGGAGNLAIGRGVIAATRRAFGPAPTDSSVASSTKGTTMRSERASGKYGSLYDYLHAVPASDLLTMSFVEIDDICGGLPPSARRHRAWWANPADDQHPHARAWLHAGWRVHNVDLEGEKVTFIATG
jgi:hypothetical protein